MERKLSNKGMIIDICSMRDRTRKLKNDNLEYSSLIEAITAKNYYNDESLSIPSLKELSIIANISYPKSGKILRKLYADLCSYEVGINVPIEINNTEVLFSLKGIFNTVKFNVKSLSVIPRKGETVWVFFFKEYTGSNYFHVADIYHEINENIHQVLISLKPGEHNAYWQIRKDQAVETGEISYKDYLMKSDRELKDVLDIKPGNPW
jgi:hypothetical protein